MLTEHETHQVKNYTKEDICGEFDECCPGVKQKDYETFYANEACAVESVWF